MGKTLTEAVRDYLIESTGLDCYSSDAPDIDNCVAVSQVGSREPWPGLPLLKETIQIVSRAATYEQSLANGSSAFLNLEADDVVTKLSAECDRLILSVEPQQGPTGAGRDPTDKRFLSVFNVDITIDKGGL